RGARMRRRDFIAILGAVGARSVAAQAKQPRRVGVLLLFAREDAEGQARVAAFKQGLQDHGWINAPNVDLHYRFAAGDNSEANKSAKELVDAKCDVILAQSPLTILAIRRYSESVPVVFVMMSNPISLGITKNFSRPGENLTGFTHSDVTIVGKWLELLK